MLISPHCVSSISHKEPLLLWLNALKNFLVQWELEKMFDQLIVQCLRVPLKCKWPERERRKLNKLTRTPAPRPNPEERLQTIEVHFLRSVNRELILRTARFKSELIWEGNHIMIFLDFSRATQLKRDKFRDGLFSFLDCFWVCECCFSFVLLWMLENKKYKSLKNGGK